MYAHAYGSFHDLGNQEFVKRSMFDTCNATPLRYIPRCIPRCIPRRIPRCIPLQRPFGQEPGSTKHSTCFATYPNLNLLLTNYGLAGKGRIDVCTCIHIYICLYTHILYVCTRRYTYIHMHNYADIHFSGVLMVPKR